MFSASSEAILMPLVSNMFQMQFYPCGFTDVMNTQLDLVFNPNALQLIAPQNSNHMQPSPVTLWIIPKPFSGSCV